MTEHVAGRSSRRREGHNWHLLRGDRRRQFWAVEDSILEEQGACLCLPSCSSCVRLCVTPWPRAHQAPLSMGFSRLGRARGVLVSAKSLQSCLTLCDPMAYSPSGSSVHGILQARILEWAAMPSSRGSSQPKDQTRLSYISCISRQVL